jgi:drug/metabolite transporter (DMT)-like permease
VAGITLGFSGAIALIIHEGISLENDIFLGDVFIFLNAMAYGTYLVIVRPLMQRYSALTLSKWVFLFGMLMVTPFGMNQALAVSWATLPTEVWLSIAFVIVATTLVVYALNAWTLKFVKSATVGSYIYLQPVFATIVAILLEKDTFDPQKLIFALLIFCGVYLVSKSNK